MIILITGASHTGKTLLAQRLLEKYRYPYLSIDHLKMGLIRSGKTSLTPKDDDALTEYLWPIVREMIKTAIENRQNLIVEGCYVPSDWRKDFDEAYLPSIRFICLVMTGNYIDMNFGEIARHNSVIESRLDDSDCTLDALKAENRKCLEGFAQAGEQVVLIDGNYEEAVKTMLEIINKGLYTMNQPLCYTREPVCLDSILNPDRIEELMESLARYFHEVWASDMIANGWTYGPTRDDMKREHPCIIPYEDLSEGEKDMDRSTSMSIIKFILDKGFQIV